MTVRVRTRGSGTNWIHLMTSGTPLSTHEWWTQAPYNEQSIDKTHPGPPYLTGSPFDLTRHTYLRGQSGGVDLTGAFGRYATGSFTDGYFGISPTGGNLPSLPSKLSGLEAAGGTGWARYKPGKPKVDLGQFIGELHQVPTIPKLIKSIKGLGFSKREQLRSFKDSGSDYLNIVFGWKPFVKTLMDMYKLSRTLDKNLSQLKKDNGRGVRRGGLVDVVQSSSTVESTGVYLYPVLTNDMYDNLQGHRSVTTSSMERYWFSARFKYHIKDIGTQQWTNRATRALFGLNPNPALLWELLPWSWLVDWFANVGDVIDNMSENSAENLAADYAYIMGSKVSETLVTEHMDLNDGSRASVTSSVSTINKHRMQASPYGFGLTPGDLSGSQMAILAALGISRSGW